MKSDAPYKIKRLLFDIETVPMEVASYSLWPKAINSDYILNDFYIMCLSYKWHHEDKIITFYSNKNNDKTLIKKFVKVLEKADEIIYHNGKKFDYKKFNTRLIKWGLDPINKPREVDTLVQARKHFSFSSNKLDYLAKFLNCRRKIHIDPYLWIKCIQGNKEAIKEMGLYNANDVLVLEDVYNVMAPYIDVGYNYNILNGIGDRCPKCGSSNFAKKGFSYTAVSVYQRYKCLDCKKQFHSGQRNGRPYKVPPCR